MTTPRLGGYGTGVFVGDAAHHEVITRNGTIDDFDASLNYYPEKDVTVIVLGNVRTNAPDKLLNRSERSFTVKAFLSIAIGSRSR